MLTRPDDVLLEASERNLQRFGDTATGACWPNETDRRTRFDVMLDLINCPPNSHVVLCDFACGTGELLAHIRRRGFRNIVYVGADRSATALQCARAKFPEETFVEIDVHAPGADLSAIACDYLVANELFTVKYGMSHEQMWSFLVSTIDRLWPMVRRGLAFNVMSKVVDRERDDLFHLTMDDAARLLHRLAGQQCVCEQTTDFTSTLPLPIAASRRRPSHLLSLPRNPHCRYWSLRRTGRCRCCDRCYPQLIDLSPYLRRIDASRFYTNHGPLVCELERRLADHFRIAAGHCGVSKLWHGRVNGRNSRSRGSGDT